MARCRECWDDELDPGEVCPDCGCCEMCCVCDELYDADELGLDPEDDDVRRYGKRERRE